MSTTPSTRKRRRPVDQRRPGHAVAVLLLAVSVIFGAIAAAPVAAAATSAVASQDKLVPFGPAPAAGLGRPTGDTSSTARVSLDIVLHSKVVRHAAPPATAVRAVKSWLTKNHVRARLVGSALVITARVTTISRLLHVRFENYRYGTTTIYASTRPFVPSNLTHYLSAILGLSNAPVMTSNAGVLPGTRRSTFPAGAVHAHFGGPVANGGPTPCSAATTEAGSSYYTLNAVGSHYGIGSLISAGDEGSGVTIAAVEFAPTSSSDISTYDTCFGISSTNYSVTQVDGGASGSYLEPDLDVEQLQTQAPLAKVISYEGPDTMSGAYDVLNAIVTADTAKVISVSWGLCEAQEGSSAGSMDALYAQAASQGQTVLVASGDQGSEECDSAGEPSAAAVQYPSSDPNVTAVGGTTMGSGTDVTWNDCGSAPSITCSQSTSGGASGGGISTLFTEPSWQKSVVTVPGSCQSTSSCRAVPDVSGNAENNVFYYSGTWAVGYGTSFSAPLLAGMVADIVPSCSTSIGNLAPRLYSYYSTYGYGAGLTDVTTGNNDWTDAFNHAEYAAGAGYDYATGLGTPLATGLLCPEGTSLSTTSATPGSSITISGSNLLNTTVTFGATSATITSATSASLTVTVPSGAGSTNVTVSSPIGSASPMGFTYPAPSITSASSATATVGSPFSFTVTTTGTPTPSMSESGGLPSGLSFVDNGNGTATISGTPSTGSGAGYALTLSATNGSGTGTQSFTLNVDEPPSFTSTNTTTFAMGSPGSFTPTAHGYPLPTITESGATLPSGVTFSGGTLSGTPANGTEGSYSISFTASNGIGSNATQAFTFIVGSTPSITSAASATFTAGDSGNFFFEASGYPSPTFSHAGTLPGGVALGSNGTLSGTPAAGSGGVYPITATATNGAGSANQSFTLYVDSSPSLVFPGGSQTTFDVGTPGNYEVETSGYPTASITRTGGLPPGVTFADNGNGTGTLSGAPAAGTTGSYAMSFTSSNAFGQSTQVFTLDVNAAPQFTSSASATFTQGSADAFTVTATGTPSPSLRYSGSLPPGMSFSGSTLQGTPSAAGSYSVNLTASNSAGSANQTLVVTVNPLPSPPTTAPPPSPTTTPAPPPPAKPVVSAGSRTAPVTSSVAEILVRCAGATCSGTVTLRLKAGTVLHLGKRVDHVTRTTTLGSGRFLIAKDGSESVRTVLNTTGRTDFSGVSSHRLTVVETITVSGGATKVSNLVLDVPAPKPVINSASSTATVRGSVASVSLKCTEAKCSGTITLEIRTTVRVRKGTKVVDETKVTSFGSVRYSLATGRVGTFKVTLNPTGRSDLAKAKGHRLTVTEDVTVTRGLTRSSSVVLAE